MISPCDILESRLGELYKCSRAGEYWRVTTPLVYPDGDMIEVYCKALGNRVIVSDMGDTYGWLMLNSVSSKLSPKHKEMFDRIAYVNGVENDRNMIKTIVSVESTHDAIVRVAQAAARAADISFTFRARDTSSTADEVEEYLADNSVRFDRNVEMPSVYGRVHTVHFRTVCDDTHSLVALLTAGTKSAAQPTFNRTLRMWEELYDTQGFRQKYNFVSLFDDTAGVWTEGELALIQKWSATCLWSDPDTFLHTLKHAA